MTSRRIGKASAYFLACFLASGPLSFAQTQETVIPPGVSISHFAHIDAQVYVGSKPRTDEDFEFLQSQHIKYILNARFLPFLSGLEKRKAKRYGMTFLSVPMNASPIPPSQKHVNQILLTLKDPRFQPIYLHCVLGRDRTGLITGLYRIYLLKVSKREAWEEMRRSGFKTWWIVHGLTAYFNKYATRPPSMPAARLGSKAPDRSSIKCRSGLLRKYGMPRCPDAGQARRRPVRHFASYHGGFEGSISFAAHS